MPDRSHRRRYRRRVLEALTANTGSVAQVVVQTTMVAAVAPPAVTGAAEVAVAVTTATTSIAATAVAVVTALPPPPPPSSPLVTGAAPPPPPPATAAEPLPPPRLGATQSVRRTSILESMEVRETKAAAVSDGEDDISRVNQYTLLDELGSGAFARVRKATFRDEDGEDSTVAIKIFSKAALKKKRTFVKTGGAMKVITALDKAAYELALMKKVIHPHVVRCYEIIDDPDADELFLVLELVPNGQAMYWDSDELRYRVDRDDDDNTEPCSEQRAREILRDTALVHSNRIVHRDIKPENILMADGCAKLADLGVAHMFAPDDTSNGMLTSSDGTPHFLAPEVVAAAGPFDAYAADIWSLGVTLYALVVGKVPFTGSNGPDINRAILNDELVIPGTLSADLQDLLRRLLERDPSRRITMAQLLAHPWINHGAVVSLADTAQGTADLHVSQEEMDRAVTRILNLRTMTKLKVRMSAVRRRSTARLEMLRTASAQLELFAAASATVQP